jgi:hypothetical protein
MADTDENAEARGHHRRGYVYDRRWWRRVVNRRRGRVVGVRIGLGDEDVHTAPPAPVTPMAVMPLAVMPLAVMLLAVMLLVVIRL